MYVLSEQCSVSTYRSFTGAVLSDYSLEWKNEVRDLITKANVFLNLS